MSKEPGVIPIVAEAADLVGGVTKLAEILGIERPALYQWKQVPPLRVLAIEAATGGKITRHQMRPDLYPVEAAA